MPGTARSARSFHLVRPVPFTRLVRPVRLAAAALAALLCAGCSSLPPLAQPADWVYAPMEPDCYERPEVRAYGKRIREQMLAAWEIPEGTPADERVVLKLVLARDGRIERIALFEASHRRFAESAIRALEAVAPFEPMPEGATCLAGPTLRASFWNPVAPAM